MKTGVFLKYALRAVRFVTRAVLITIIVLCLLIYFLFFFNAYQKKGEMELAQILGLSEVSVLSSDHSFDPFVIQDCDLMEVFQLSGQSVCDFVTHSTFKLYDEVYENDSTRSWVKANWCRTPIDSVKYEEALDFAFSYRQNEKRNEWLKEMWKILASDTGYYAFYYRELEISFYVLNLNDGKLYIIYLEL